MGFLGRRKRWTERDKLGFELWFNALENNQIKENFDVKPDTRIERWADWISLLKRDIGSARRARKNSENFEENF